MGFDGFIKLVVLQMRQPFVTSGANPSYFHIGGVRSLNYRSVRLYSLNVTSTVLMASSDVTASLTIKFDSVRGKSLEITQITGPSVGVQIFFRDKNPIGRSLKPVEPSVRAFKRFLEVVVILRRASLVFFVEIIVT